MGIKASSPTVPQLQDIYPLPKKYKHLKVVGEGGFGVVLKCLDRDTKNTVAIKIAKASGGEIEEEASMLHTLMANKLDQKNIVKFHGGFWRNRCMVFEMLDINLDSYIRLRDVPMRLQDIRAVMQQMATAFDALKSIGVIHTDLKTDNIMLVDRARRPFRVKLIDFGLAVFNFRAKHIKVCPVPDFRAPEIIFGFPYSEAMDIWSLGCVMANMLFGCTLFPGRFNHELIYYMCDLLGAPPDSMITASSRSEDYFTKDALNQWIPKVSEEYRDHRAFDRRLYTFRSLEEKKTTGLEEDNTAEATERSQCIELLKATLRWDEKERITAAGILHHPFITKSYLSSSSQQSSWSNQPADSNAEEAAQSSSNQTADCGTMEAQTGTQQTTEGFHVDENRPSGGLIVVQPAPPHCRSPLEADESTVSVTCASVSEDNNGKVILNTDDSQDEEEKRPIGVKRFFSCMRKRVCLFRKVRVAPI